VEALEASDALWVAGAARFVDADDNVTEVWRPEPPRGGRHWWILAPWGVPQPATFWRRECFERYGPFREDMHYVFDTEHGIRLALAGHLPVLVDRELAVRVVHDEAKSWDVAPFQREHKRFAELFQDQLTPRERRLLRVNQALLRAGVYRLTGAASRTYRRLGGPPLRNP
jgi:hypothetical protein